MEETQELIDAEEVENEYYDTDEGSVVINFQHAMPQMKQLKVHSKNRDEKHENGRQKDERQMISRRISMAATRASRSKKYSDNDIILDIG